MNINYCNFINNNHYTGDGVAIGCKHCNSFWSVLTININNCNFSDNGDSESIVHFLFSSHYYSTHIYLNNTNYQNNKGTSVYLHDDFVLHINGETLFDSNKAEYGAGIYARRSSAIITFDKNSNVNFVKNHVSYKGAAIFLGRNSSVTFEQNSAVTFNDNKATSG